MYRHLFGVTGPVSIMQKTTQAMLGVLLMITMSLSMGLGEMSVNDENVNHTSARGDTNCTSDEGCPDGYTCSSDGVCVAQETCDVDGDCPDGETCEDGTCENTVPENNCEDTNQETNEDGTCGVCLDGYGLDENGDCVEDPSLDNSCTSDADCENGQICGAAGDCMDAPDDSGNGTDGNETNDGGNESQYKTCGASGSLENMTTTTNGPWRIAVCDEETGEWVELEDTRPTSVEIGCDEEPTEEQLDASNLADLLNEHGEILIRDEKGTYYMAKSGHLSGQYEDMQNVVVLSAMSTGDNGNGGFVGNQSSDGMHNLWIAVTFPKTSDNWSQGGAERTQAVTWMSFSTGGNGSDELLGGPDMWMSFSTGGNDSLNAEVGSFVLAEGFVTGGGNGGSITEYGYYMSFSTCGNGSGGLGCPGGDSDWTGLGGDGSGVGVWIEEDGYYMSFSTGENGSADRRAVVYQSVSTGGSDHYFKPGVGDRLIIGMDGNGNVTNANIVRSTTTDSGCLMVEDLESTNKDVEDESSGVLVAAGGVEVTTRDAAFVVGGVGVGLFGGSIITRILRPNVFNSTVKAHAEKAAAKERK
jgi:hypothetical protein